MNKKESSSLDNLDPNEVVVPIKRKERLALDGPVPEDKDWLTPLNPGTEFVVTSAGFGYFKCLDFYRKVCNYNKCIFLIEEYEGKEIPRYVQPELFCKHYSLVEILHNG